VLFPPLSGRRFFFPLGGSVQLRGGVFSFLLAASLIVFHRLRLPASRSFFVARPAGLTRQYMWAAPGVNVLCAGRR